nr:MAG TPA: hypothetical protein [Caudoviricetes sp.]DAO05065.1 MAG TPA: hypothetical protein [Bacteriophage sp.]
MKTDKRRLATVFLTCPSVWRSVFVALLPDPVGLCAQVY